MIREGDLVKKVITMLMSSMFLVACGIDEARYEDFDIIDIHNPVNERAIIEHAMEEQRELLKPGFITEWSDTSYEFRLSFQSIIYDASSGELKLEADYKHSGSSAFLSFTATKNPADDPYQETIDQLHDAAPLDHPELTGFYGATEYNGKTYYEFAAKGDNAVYVYKNTRSESEGYDAELAKWIGESLATEKDGAHSQFYDRFSLESDQLHFPMLNETFIQHINVEVFDFGYYELDRTNRIHLVYHLIDGSTFTYGIDQMNFHGKMDHHVYLDEGETENGLTVTEYEDTKTGDALFIWEIDEYYYSLLVDYHEEPLTTGDIYAIIDSASDDNREFDNEHLFTETNEEPILTDIDKKVLGKLRKLEN